MKKLEVIASEFMCVCVCMCMCERACFQCVVCLCVCSRCFCRETESFGSSWGQVDGTWEQYHNDLINKWTVYQNKDSCQTKDI
jgi:hypothetical protein